MDILAAQRSKARTRGQKLEFTGIRLVQISLPQACRTDTKNFIRVVIVLSLHLRMQNPSKRNHMYCFTKCVHSEKALFI